MRRVGDRVFYVDQDDGKRYLATFVGYYMDLGCRRAVIQPHHLPEYELVMRNDDELEYT